MKIREVWVAGRLRGVLACGEAAAVCPRRVGRRCWSLQRPHLGSATDGQKVSKAGKHIAEARKRDTIIKKAGGGHPREFIWKLQLRYAALHA